jgi:hypothetical protein
MFRKLEVERLQALIEEAKKRIGALEAELGQLDGRLAELEARRGVAEAEADEAEAERERRIAEAVDPDIALFREHHDPFQDCGSPSLLPCSSHRRTPRTIKIDYQDSQSCPCPTPCLDPNALWPLTN